jgi:peptidoglycan/LPS O-acetylase OafA/YrhL
MPLERSIPKRRFDLDWLRVLAILAVFIFHSGRFFDTDSWHVKNSTTYFGMQVWTTFLANWLMPFIFVISGASLFFALGSRGAWKFIDDKVKRLFIPLVIGIFTHIMFQVYLERITHHQFYGSFFEFIPHYFDGWYGFGGNFAWMGLHLWYLLILFIYSLLFYPLFRWLSAGTGKNLLKRIGDFLALPGAVYLLALPIAWTFVSIDPHAALGMRDFGGWSLPVYILFFLYGFIVISHEGLQKRIQQYRFVSLVAAIMCIFSLLFLWAREGDPTFGSTRYILVFGIFSISSWCWILSFLGLGFKYLTENKPILARLNEAVLPFYILHQTVLLTIGYFVTQWEIPAPAKFALISSSSFIVIVVIYEFLIRRWDVMRVLFGMKVKAKPQTKDSKVTGQIGLQA